MFVVDNTFASPFVLRPLAYGADVVVHSVTKFLNGHSDVIAGCVASSEGFLREVQRRIVTYGSCLDPHAAFLVFRGLRTFWVRLRSQIESAAKIAEFLVTRDDVTRVVYPSLSDYTSREVAERLLHPGRGGAMVSFVVEGGDDRALEVMRRLRIPTEATSLGGVESLVSTPFNSSHFSLSPDERRLAGIDSGMIRLSVGLEDTDELIDDLSDSLDATRW
jgi:cystathionine beta-lyase/cystathionine gamma-synthase